MDELIYKPKKKKENAFLKFCIILFLILFTVEMLSFLLLKSDLLTGLYIKLLFGITITFSLFMIKTWSGHDKIAAIIFFILLIKLIVESLLYYGKPLVHPSVLAVMSPFIYVYFIKYVSLKLKMDYFRYFNITVLLSYFVFMLLYGIDFSFSIAPVITEETGPFAGDSRILHSNSILLVIVPYLFYLNEYIKKKSLKNLFLFLVPLLIIVIHQHRTVWVSTILSTLLFFFIKSRSFSVILKLLSIVIIIVLVIVIAMFAVPEFTAMFAERFDDVFDPLNPDNTAGWRYIQILSYLDLVFQKPIFGWSFAGFRLPNQFMIQNSESEGTGHHFHDSYLEVLFYFGIIGLLIKYYPLYKIAKQAFKYKLSEKSQILSAFCISGFLYSFSYVPPLAFWAVTGMCMYYITIDIVVYEKTKKNG